MEILGLFLSIVSLIWTFKNQSKIETLEDQQLRLQKKFARLQIDLERKADERSPSPNVLSPREPGEVPGPSMPPPRVRAAETAVPPVISPRPVAQAPSASKPSPSVSGETLQTPRPAPPASQPSAVPASVRPAFDWEALIGVKLFSWIAGIALVFAATFFLKYSVDHGWLSPPVRMGIGLLTGAGLLAFCEWKAARRYAITANALDGAGIAILFSTFFAGHSLWGLLPVLPTFGLMALVTALAVLLSIRHNSMFAALLGLLGGFATPALLSSGDDRPIGLFTYLLLLNAGLAWVAHRKRWPALTVVSSVFTTIYQWLWVAQFLRTSNVPLSLGIFLVFPILGFAATAFGERRNLKDEKSALFRHTSSVSGVLPFFFAIFMAATPAYGANYWLLFGFLFLIDAGLAVIAWKRGPEELHLAGGIGTLLTFAMFLRTSYTSAAWPAVLGFTCVFVLFYLASGYGLPFKSLGTRGALTAPILLASFPILAAIEPASASPAGFFSTLLVLTAVAATYAVARQHGSVYLVAGFFALAAEAVWSAKYLDAARLIPALFIYAVFGLFYLAVPLVARRLKRRVDSSLFDQSLYFSLSGHVFLFFVVLQESLAIPPWPVLGVLALLNLAIGTAALYLRRSALHLGAIVASQLILTGWQVAAKTPPWPSVAVLCALAVALMGFVWMFLGRKLGLHLSERPGSLLAAASALAGFLGLAAVAVAETLSGVPGFGLLVAATAIFIGFLLATDQFTEWRVLAPLSVIAAAVVVLLWTTAVRPVMGNWSQELLFAGVPYVLFLAYPLWQGERIKTSIGPHLAAVLASMTFFFFARHSLTAGGLSAGIGLLPVTQAALLSILLHGLVRQGSRPKVAGRLALVAGAVLAFVTAAIPLQLEKQWITVGWALQAAALAWLFRRIPNKGLYLWTSGLLAAVFIRLALNPAVLTYHARSGTPIVNWYLYTYLLSALALFVAAWLLRDEDRVPAGVPPVSPLAAAGGSILLFLLLNIEIADFYSTGSSLTFDLSAGLAQNLTYTIGWGLFSFGMLSAGILLASRAARVASILLLSVTVGKCFLYDLRHLGGLYRIGSLVGLAICLTLVAVLLQKFVLRPQSEMK